MGDRVSIQFEKDARSNMVKNAKEYYYSGEHEDEEQPTSFRVIKLADGRLQVEVLCASGWEEFGDAEYLK